MKTAIMVVVALAALALTACASTSSTYAARYKAFEPRLVTDTDYMARVEAANRQVGNRVVWVNPPKRATDESGNGSD